VAKAIDTCFLCDSIPCRCFGNARKSRASSSKQGNPEPTPAVAQKKVALPTRTPITVPVVKSAKPRARFDPSSIKNIQTEEEAELRRAATVLAMAFELDVETLESHRNLIDLPAWKIDAMIWKQKARGEAKENANSVGSLARMGE